MENKQRNDWNDVKKIEQKATMASFHIRNENENKNKTAAEKNRWISYPFIFVQNLGKKALKTVTNNTDVCIFVGVREINSKYTPELFKVWT